MKYSRKSELEHIRKSNKPIELFAVYNHLALGVFKIKKLSKQYVYWEDDTNHPYPSSASDYVLFDDELEAYEYYLKLYYKRKTFIEEWYKQKLKQLTIAGDFVNCYIKVHPEIII